MIGRFFTSHHLLTSSSLLTLPVQKSQTSKASYRCPPRQISNSRIMSSCPPDNIELCKISAANKAVDDNINENTRVIGIGSGSTMVYVLRRLRTVCTEKQIEIQCIPTSFQSKQLIIDEGFPLTDIDRYPSIDITIDGADEVDSNLVAIKGGGACLAQEKVVACAAKKFVVVADFRKHSKVIGESWKKGIPIETLPMSTNFVRHKIHEIFGTNMKDLIIRQAKEKAGPVITDNGNFIVDWKLDYNLIYKSQVLTWPGVDNKLKMIPGVLETGIFSNIIDRAYFGNQDGTSVTTVTQ